MFDTSLILKSFKNWIKIDENWKQSIGGAFSIGTSCRFCFLKEICLSAFQKAFVSIFQVAFIKGWFKNGWKNCLRNKKDALYVEWSKTGFSQNLLFASYSNKIKFPRLCRWRFLKSGKNRFFIYLLLWSMHNIYFFQGTC